MTSASEVFDVFSVAISGDMLLMPATLTPAERHHPEVIEIGDTLIAESYPDLAEAEVSINYLLAEPGKRGPALKLNGYACEATVKVNSFLDRVEGKKDVTISLDLEVWESLDEDERIGLVAHELEYLVVKRHAKGEEAGQIKTDAAGRPVVGCRRHDIIMGGFESIARRHGSASPEARAARVLKDRYGQLLWEWSELKITQFPGRGVATVSGR